MISGAWFVAGMALVWAVWCAFEAVAVFKRWRWRNRHCWLCGSPTIIRDGERRCVRCEYRYSTHRRILEDLLRRDSRA